MAEDERPTEVTCISPLVLCPGSTVCISQSQQCDGKSDCPGGSDEAFCLYTCAKPGNMVLQEVGLFNHWTRLIALIRFFFST